jgi:hypothetical protein
MAFGRIALGTTPAARPAHVPDALFSVQYFTPHQDRDQAGAASGNPPLRVRPHGGTVMNDHTLQVGDELLLGGDTRVTVLAVEGDTVWLGITAPEGAWVVAPEAPGREALRGAALTAQPGSN